jgi:hypothetical protein
MSKRASVFVLIASVALLSAWIMVPPGPAAQEIAERPNGRFMTVGGVLLETSTGKTWLLEAVEGDSAWRPIKRFDDYGEFLVWKKKEKEKRANQLMQQRKEAEKREIERRKERLKTGLGKE